MSTSSDLVPRICTSSPRPPLLPLVLRRRLASARVLRLPRRRLARPNTAAPATNPPAATAIAWADGATDLTSALPCSLTGAGTGTASTSCTTSISLTSVSLRPGPDLFFAIASGPGMSHVLTALILHTRPAAVGATRIADRSVLAPPYNTRS